MTGYSLHVKSYNKRHTNLVVTNRSQFLAATRGSKYCIIADNKTDHPTSVTITIGQEVMGMWMLPARTKLTIKNEREEEHSTTFIFEDDEHTYDQYSIKAEFEPAGYIVTIPIHLCDHEVNTQ